MAYRAAAYGSGRNARDLMIGGERLRQGEVRGLAGRRRQRHPVRFRFITKTPMRSCICSEQIFDLLLQLRHNA